MKTIDSYLTEKLVIDKDVKLDKDYYILILPVTRPQPSMKYLFAEHTSANNNVMMIYRFTLEQLRNEYESNKRLPDYSILKYKDFPGSDKIRIGSKIDENTYQKLSNRCEYCGTVSKLLNIEISLS